MTHTTEWINEAIPRPGALRIGTVAAFVALGACCLLAPIQSRIWNGADAPGWVDAFVAAVAPSAAASPLAVATMPQPPPLYFAFGRAFLLVYAALIAATLSNPRLTPSWARRALVALLAIAASGDVLAYWLSESAGPALRSLGFWRIEVPALALLLGTASFAGLRFLRARSAALPEAGLTSAAVAWSFALCAPLAVLTTGLLRYMPHGLVLPFALATALHASVSPIIGAEPARSRWWSARTIVGRGAIALLILAVVLAMWWLPYRPVVVAGKPAASGPYRVAAPVSGLRLHVFNTGANRMSSLLVSAERPWRPVPAFVIEHPRRGLIVFDAGLSPEVAERGEAALGIPMRWLFESRGRVGRTLEAQMREAGLEPAAVGSVIISHLHPDHTGAASAFAKATFIGGAGSDEHHLDGGFAPPWREIDFAAGPASPPFDQSVDLFGDGSVVLIHGGGHTREDVLVLLALPEGPVLLAGDAVVHRDWLRSDDVQRIASDPQRAADVRNQVRAFVAGVANLVLIPGHDLSGVPSGRADLVLHHPEWFAADAWPIDP